MPVVEPSQWSRRASWTWQWLSSPGPKYPCVVMSECTVIAVPWSCICFYFACHCNARLCEDVDVVKDIMQVKANFLGECLQILCTEHEHDEDEAVPQDTCGGKASGKGKPLRVAPVGDDSGPKWHREGWAHGFKLWVGDLPGDIQKQAIGQHCAQCVDIAINSNRTASGAAYAIVTFHDLAAAFKAFEELAMAKFHHGNGLMLWPTVKWFRGKPLANV